MNKLFFTTILALLSLGAFSQKADAAVTLNDTLTINITVSIDVNVRIVWTDTLGVVAKNWNLADVAVATDFYSNPTLNLQVTNETANVNLDLDIEVGDSSAAANSWSQNNVANPGQNEYSLAYEYAVATTNPVAAGGPGPGLSGVGAAGTYTYVAAAALPAFSNSLLEATIPPAAVRDFQMRLKTPSTVTAARPGVSVTVNLVATAL